MTLIQRLRFDIMNEEETELVTQDEKKMVRKETGPLAKREEGKIVRKGSEALAERGMEAIAPREKGDLAVKDGDAMANTNEKEETSEEPEDKSKDETKGEGTEAKIAELEGKIQELEGLLKEREEKLSEFIDRLQRTHADFENYKKRIERERAEFIERSKEELITKLLADIDNFERALDSSERQDAEALRKGLELVYRHFLDTLKHEGLKEIDAQGKEFDPYRHEAVMQMVSDEHKEDTVIEVLEKGYMLHDKVIRASKVKISKRPDSKSESEENEEETEEGKNSAPEEGRKES